MEIIKKKWMRNLLYDGFPKIQRNKKQIVLYEIYLFTSIFVRFYEFWTAIDMGIEGRTYNATKLFIDILLSHALEIFVGSQWWKCIKNSRNNRR